MEIECVQTWDPAWNLDSGAKGQHVIAEELFPMPQSSQQQISGHSLLFLSGGPPLVVCRSCASEKHLAVPEEAVEMLSSILYTPIYNNYSISSRK